MLSKVIRAAASRGITVSLFISLFASYIYFTFGKEPFEKWMNFVFHTPAGIIIYWAIIINLLLADIRVVYKRLQAGWITPENIQEMDAHVEIPAHDNSLEHITGWIKEKGFRVNIHGDCIYSIKGRFSFLPGAVLRAGFIILMVSIFFSVHIRKTEDMVLHEGEEGIFLGNRVHLSLIKSNFPEEFFYLGEDSAFKVDGVSAILSSSGKNYDITPRFPVRIGGLYYRITHLGFSHSLLVTASSGDFEKRIDLDMLPPGKTDLVALPQNDVFLTFTLYPEKMIKKGILTGKLYNLKKPLYSIVVQKGKEKEKSDGITIDPGGNIILGGITVSLGSNSLYSRIGSVRDPALPWIYIGILFTLTGVMLMLSRFFWYKEEFSAVLKDEVVFIGYIKEFYKSWGIRKFQRWKDELEKLN